MDMIELAERCERGSGPDRELDAIVWCAVEHPNQRPQKDFFYTAREEWGYFTTNQPLPGMTFHDAPHLTGSLDASIALRERVLPDWGWRIGAPMPSPVNSWATVSMFERQIHGVATSPARALLAAILRALAAKDETP